MRQRASTPALDLAVDGLAVYRLTRLLTEDYIADPVRVAARKRSTTLADFVTCPWCVSMWFALGTVAARTVAPRAWGGLARALAFSAAAGLIAERS